MKEKGLVKPFVFTFIILKASLFEGHGLGLDGGRHLSHFLHENEVVEVAKETIFLVDVKLPVVSGGALCF